MHNFLYLGAVDERAATDSVLSAWAILLTDVFENCVRFARTMLSLTSVDMMTLLKSAG